MKKIRFDARELEHPKPLEIGTAYMTEMDRESYLYMLHRKNPTPLLMIAKERGYRTLSYEDEKGIWHILIAKDPDIALERLLDV